MKTYVSIGLGCLSGLVITFAVCAIFGESLAVAGILMVCGLVLFGWGIIYGVRRTLPLILALGLACEGLMAQEAPEPIQAAGAPIAVGIGLGLLIGGGYVCVRVVRACAKRKHYPTNAPPDAASAPAGNYAGLMTYAQDYCDFAPTADEADNGVAIEAEVTLGEDSLPALRQSCRHVLVDALADFDAFDAQLGLWGLTYDGRPGEQYSRNGKPIDPSKCPFAFSAPWWGAPGVAIYPDQPLFHVELATSSDMRSWTPVADLWLPAATPVQILDNPSGDQSFYRLRLVGE